MSKYMQIDIRLRPFCDSVSVENILIDHSVLSSGFISRDLSPDIVHANSA